MHFEPVLCTAKNVYYCNIFAEHRMNDKYFTEKFINKIKYVSHGHLNLRILLHFSQNIQALKVYIYMMDHMERESNVIWITQK